MESQRRYVGRARDLEVYKRAYVVSLEIHKATLAFPKIEQYALADQLRRSSKAICANLAEGFAKQPHSKAEFARFISMAMGSCSEVETWISPTPSTLSTFRRHSLMSGYDPTTRSMECW
ncbi:four helix bundle protein [Mesorhizobium humile]|uniref:Four helix bundle protein n=1 Tax=Mesorhizobium humile TaxID=3072313 RepID=A0ABU4YR90_9HYPH|nr:MULTISPECIES: four helix bundle protein [unclassified Mesorhizobium]MDX8460915.1 four helix bundle protein [Mesorhizobium sp. VK2D]MDX8489482.1 four helix bundle protein [Mesorhizobium sp. VK2B]